MSFQRNKSKNNDIINDSAGSSPLGAGIGHHNLFSSGPKRSPQRSEMAQLLGSATTDNNYEPRSSSGTRVILGIAGGSGKKSLHKGSVSSAIPVSRPSLSVSSSSSGAIAMTGSFNDAIMSRGTDRGSRICVVFFSMYHVSQLLQWFLEMRVLDLCIVPFAYNCLKSGVSFMPMNVTPQFDLLCTVCFDVLHICRSPCPTSSCADMPESEPHLWLSCVGKKMRLLF